MIDFQEQGQFRTPMLVPSYSSKGFPKVDDIIKATGPYIDSEILVSAYDIHYEYVKTDLTFPSMIFLDSGGYEAAVDHDLSEQLKALESEYKPKAWDNEKFEKIVADWSSLAPTVFISYDNPKDRCSYQAQIERARTLGGAATSLKRELLLKPPTPESQYLRMNEITPLVSELSSFCAVGVTEKEVGKDLLERMVNIGKLRKAMDEAGVAIPIHVFGSLDTTSTFLYFVMGADIFDGLTWLRYGYYRGTTLYRQEFAALQLPPNRNYKKVPEDCWYQNYIYLQSMEQQMRRFLNDGDFSSFTFNGDVVENLYKSAIETIGG